MKIRIFISTVLKVFFWMLQRFSLFSAAFVLCHYKGTIVGMFLHGLFWPYKLLYWVIKNFIINQGFRETFGDALTSAGAALLGAPTNLIIRTIPTLIIIRFFVLLHFFPGICKSANKFLQEKLRV